VSPVLLQQLKKEMLRRTSLYTTLNRNGRRNEHGPSSTPF
jgi:hypothetical protein